MSGFLIQSNWGAQKANFEVVYPSLSQNAFAHFWRENDTYPYTWSAPDYFAKGYSPSLPARGFFNGGVSLIQSNFQTAGAGGSNLEVVTVLNSAMYHFYRAGEGAWSGPTVQISNNVRGWPGLIQSNYGTQGNFEVVVAAQGGGLLHYYRDNDVAGFPWHFGTAFGDQTILFDTVSLIQSSFGGGKNLEVVAWSAATNQLIHFWRDSNLMWHEEGPVPNPVNPLLGSGPASWTQSNLVTPGNFEVALVGAGLIYYSRQNNVAGLPWNGGQVIADGPNGAGGYAPTVPSIMESTLSLRPGFDVVLLGQPAPSPALGLLHFMNDPINGGGAWIPDYIGVP
jgi:hypothetical protein